MIYYKYRSTISIDPADHKVVRITIDCKFKSFEY